MVTVKSCTHTMEDPGGNLAIQLLNYYGARVSTLVSRDAEGFINEHSDKLKVEKIIADSADACSIKQLNQLI